MTIDDKNFVFTNCTLVRMSAEEFARFDRGVDVFDRDSLLTEAKRARASEVEKEAQCAAMRGALEIGVMGYDASLRESRGYGIPVALWDWVQRALASDAGKAGRRMNHHEVPGAKHNE